jgi:xylan 1,4-beta-xylosidase
VDLGSRCRVRGIQTNFADEGARGIVGSSLPRSYEYVIEATTGDSQSSSGSGPPGWHTLVTRGRGSSDAPHDWAELPTPVDARTIRITNSYSPAGGKFSLSGFRVFGSCSGSPPAAVTGACQRLFGRWTGPILTLSPHPS